MNFAELWLRIGRWWGIALAIFILDRLTKVLVESSLHVGQEIAFTSFFDLTLRYNSGAAFSFLAGAGGWQLWFFSLIAIAVVIGITWRLYCVSTRNQWEAYSLTLILGGAIGNLYDRLDYGHVVDFIQFHWMNQYYFPAFNLADSAITCGVVVMLLEGFWLKKAAREA